MTLADAHARILADPHGDAPRLAYADLVEATVPEHAWLIREQVQYVRDRAAGVDWPPRRTTTMYSRSRKLMWRLVPDAVRDLLNDGFEVRRGFIESVTLPIAALPPALSRLVAALPLRRLRLTRATPAALIGLAGVADLLPGLGQLRGLSLEHEPIGDAGLAGLPPLPQLRWLDLTGTDVTAAGLEALAASPHFPALRFVRADRELGLNPEPAYDWDGTPVWVDEAPLAAALGARYDRPWLHRGTVDVRDAGYIGPNYDEV
ncbi:hypothetical protein Dvina_23035 [Dactylosporangium vinaceum]|uniref:Leucine-rich repeat domain-containing protein n=1 Tax=Dactylosporangium vinaceum TaxID=53362 RepID=A0ABV5MQY7_9ACTN|nr:hypothetical protein [Dactylosporangium vinaceum]UAC00670.1 hypothetical protein Dvina_23035 [Dactylosporangium vinaceum]